MTGLISILGALSLAAGPGYRDTVDVHTVLVEVHVTDSAGRFVPGLDIEDFTLHEDGESRAIQSVREVHHVPPGARRPGGATAETLPVPPRHFIFVYDMYMSRPWSLRKAARAAAEWAEANLGPGDRVSVATITTRLSFLVEDQPVSELVTLAIENVQKVRATFIPTLGDGFVADIHASGSERDVGRMGEALETLALRIRDRPGPKAVILVTEPGATFTAFSSPATYRHHGERVDKQLQAAGAKLHVLLAPSGGWRMTSRAGRAVGTPASVSGSSGLGRSSAPVRSGYPYVSRSRVRSSCDDVTCEGFPAYLASLTAGNLYRGTDFSEVLEDSTRELAAYYELSFAAPRAGEPGSFRRLEVEVRGERLDVRHKRGYLLPKSYADMDHKERDQRLLSSLGGASAFLNELPVSVRLMPVPAKGDRVWLAMVARIPGDAFTSAGRFQMLGEVRDALGQPQARVNDFVRLDAEEVTEKLREEGLEYIGGALLPRGVGTVRFVARDEADGRTAVADLPFDTRSALGKPIRVETWSRPVRALGGNKGRPEGLFEFDGWAVHPVLAESVLVGGPIKVLLELPKWPRALAERLQFVLTDSSGRRHPVNPGRLEYEPAKRRLSVLAEIDLPLVEPGECWLGVTLNSRSENFQTELPMVCE